MKKDEIGYKLVENVCIDKSLLPIALFRTIDVFVKTGILDYIANIPGLVS